MMVTEEENKKKRRRRRRRRRKRRKRRGSPRLSLCAVWLGLDLMILRMRWSPVPNLKRPITNQIEKGGGRSDDGRGMIYLSC
jgi:hypothetical protein